MSLFTLNYKCPKCQHEETQYEGMRFDSDKCYHIFKCDCCNSIRSIALTEKQYLANDFPRCCDIKMEIWDKFCPICKEKMVEKIVCSEFI